MQERQQKTSGKNPQDKNKNPRPRDKGETERGSQGYHRALESRVVGQSDAIDAVAGELQLIKAGLVDPGKPASVLLFAGMTGVGKTELARRVAELYSGTRKLNVYTMGNFSEPHSVSAIIGVPSPCATPSSHVSPWQLTTSADPPPPLRNTPAYCRGMTNVKAKAESGGEGNVQ